MMSIYRLCRWIWHREIRPQIIPGWPPRLQPPARFSRSCRICSLDGTDGTDKSLSPQRISMCMKWWDVSEKMLENMLAVDINTRWMLEGRCDMMWPCLPWQCEILCLIPLFISCQAAQAEPPEGTPICAELTMAEVQKFEVEKDPEAGMESPKAEDDVKPVPPAWKEVYGGSKFEVRSLLPPFTWLPAYVRYAKGGVPRLHVTMFRQVVSRVDVSNWEHAVQCHNGGTASTGDIEKMGELPYSIKGDLIAGPGMVWHWALA